MKSAQRTCDICGDHTFKPDDWAENKTLPFFQLGKESPPRKYYYGKLFGDICQKCQRGIADVVTNYVNQVTASSPSPPAR